MNLKQYQQYFCDLDSRIVSMVYMLAQQANHANARRALILATQMEYELSYAEAKHVVYEDFPEYR